jgi:hypothetical protein
MVKPVHSAFIDHHLDPKLLLTASQDGSAKVRCSSHSQRAEQFDIRRHLVDRFSNEQHEQSGGCLSAWN